MAVITKEKPSGLSVVLGQFKGLGGKAKGGALPIITTILGYVAGITFGRKDDGTVSLPGYMIGLAVPGIAAAVCNHKDGKLSKWFNKRHVMTTFTATAAMLFFDEKLFTKLAGTPILGSLAGVGAKIGGTIGNEDAKARSSMYQQQIKAAKGGGSSSAIAYDATGGATFAPGGGQSQLDYGGTDYDSDLGQSQGNGNQGGGSNSGGGGGNSNGGGGTNFMDVAASVGGAAVSGGFSFLTSLLDSDDDEESEENDAGNESGALGANPRTRSAYSKARNRLKGVGKSTSRHPYMRALNRN